MASTVAARRLAEAHRVAQLRLGAQTVVAMRAVWDRLDPEDVDGTFEDWLTASMPIIQGQRAASAQIAANYLASSKRLQLGDGAALAPVLALDVPRQAVLTSLLVTGPISIKKAMIRGVSLAAAAAVAEAASAAAGMRHALDGGRETIVQTINADPHAKGWQRISSGNACQFCSDLSGLDISTADIFESHDGCNCSAAAVFA